VVEDAGLATLPDALRITVEPAGGSAQPSTDVVVQWPDG
jgi:hypothetical protein